MECCVVNGWEITSLKILPDHVHMLVQLNPDPGLPKVVQLLKGGSSHVIRKEHPELEEFLWGDSFWSDGYFAETIGKIDEQVIKNYIREQQASA